MRRRTYLGIASGTLAGLAGCTASAGPGAGGTADEPPTPACPELLDADATVCPGDRDAPVAVERSTATVGSDAWSIAVTVTNRTVEPYRLRPSAWSIHRRADGGWRPVVPATLVDRPVSLAAGGRYTWQLSTTGAGPDGADRRVVLSLEPSTYAFAVPVDGPDRIAAVAVFAVAD